MADQKPRTEALKDHVLSIDIFVPRQRVWDEITKTGQIQLAMNNTLLESRMVPGSKLRYYSPDRKRVFVVGEVVEVDPPRRFTHTFAFTMRAEEPTLVTWELDEIPGGCRVRLTHSGWADQVATHKGTRDGWQKILDSMKGLLETGDIPATLKLTYRMWAAMSFLLPRSTKPEEVSKAGW